MLNKANQGFSENDGMLSDCFIRINYSIHNAGVASSNLAIATTYPLYFNHLHLWTKFCPKRFRKKYYFVGNFLRSFLVKCHKNMQIVLPIFTHKSNGYSLLKPVFHHLKKTVRGLYESITYIYKREQIWQVN